MAPGGGRLHHLEQGTRRVPPARVRPGEEHLHRRLLETARSGPDHGGERVQDRALQADRIRQQVVRPGRARGRMADGHGPHPHHPRRAQIGREIRERLSPPADHRLVLRRHVRVRAARDLHPHVLQARHQHRVQALLAGRRRPVQPDGPLLRRPGRHRERLLCAERHRHVRRRRLDLAHPGRDAVLPHAFARLRDPDPAADPGRPAREGQGRLRREAPPLQGRHRSRLQRQLHPERRPHRRLPGRVGAVLRPLRHRAAAADLRGRPTSGTGPTSRSTPRSATRRAGRSTSSTGRSPSASTRPSSPGPGPSRSASRTSFLSFRAGTRSTSCGRTASPRSSRRSRPSFSSPPATPSP